MTRVLGCGACRLLSSFASMSMTRARSEPTTRSICGASRSCNSTTGLRPVRNIAEAHIARRGRHSAAAHPSGIGRSARLPWAIDRGRSADRARLSGSSRRHSGAAIFAVVSGDVPSRTMPIRYALLWRHHTILWVPCTDLCAGKNRRDDRDARDRKRPCNGTWGRSGAGYGRGLWDTRCGGIGWSI